MKINGQKVKWIPGYEGDYLISDYGEIISFKRNGVHGQGITPRFLRPKTHQRYGRISLCREG